MTDPDGPLGERVAIVETDIKHIVSGIARIEGGIARIENDLIPRTRDELNTRLSETRAELKADMGNLRTELKEDFQRTTDILETAMTHNKTVLYTICGTVLAAVVASLVKGSFF